MTATEFGALIPGMATLFATESHNATQRCMTSTGNQLLQGAMQALIPGGLAAAFALDPRLRDMAGDIAQQLVNRLYVELMPKAPITPDKAFGVAPVLLTEAAGFGAAAHFIAMAGEALAPLKHMGLGYVSAFLADMAGFSRIAAAFQGVMITWGLAQPMRYWALQKFQPMIPTEGDLIRLAGEYAITREEFNKYTEWQGYSPYWQDKLYELADRPLSPMLFRYLGEAGILDKELLDRELKNAGYNAKTIPYLKTWLEKVAAGELKGAFQGAATKRFRIGLDDEDELVANLDELGFSGTQLDKAVRAARLDRATELAEDTKKLYLDQFTKGYIEDYDLELRLSGLGYCPEVVNIEVARAALKRKPKPEAPVAPGVEKETRELQAKYVTLYTELYRKDQLTEDQFFNYLVTLGIGEELASVTVSIESAKKLPKVKA
jgi:hypothetical protein